MRATALKRRSRRGYTGKWPPRCDQWGDPKEGRDMKKALLLAAAMLAASATSAWSQAAPERSITKLAGEVYRFQNNQHYGLFQVTPAGIVVIDPINTATAQWLKGELATRFPNNPVRQVLYSHHHWDHASGAGVFSDAAVVAHASAIKMLEGPADSAPLPPNIIASDKNSDGKLQQAELAQPMAAAFSTIDKNADGGVSARELFLYQYVDVKKPTQTFSTPVHKVSLGGKTVEMHSIKSSHGPDLTFVYFPADKILFVVDVISMGRMPFGNLPGYDEAETYATIDRALAFDANIVAGGHGITGTDADLEAVRTNLKELRQGVQAGINAGQSLEQIQASLTLDKYKGWINYSTARTQNIAGMYAYLKK
jgi:glyoxylase-like metal-dependent hydrolase (beta-lactamase superfamily II)